MLDNKIHPIYSGDISNTWNCLMHVSSFAKVASFHCSLKDFYSEIIPKSKPKDQIEKYKAGWVLFTRYLVTLLLKKLRQNVSQFLLCWWDSIRMLCSVKKALSDWTVCHLHGEFKQKWHPSVVCCSCFPPAMWSGIIINQFDYRTLHYS